jgi:hypothetical protein
MNWTLDGYNTIYRTKRCSLKMATFPIDTEKWETGIDVTATEIKEVKAFIDWRLSVYKENRWKRFDLWESFVDDFESFTKGILDDLGKDRLKRIRDYLRENGVYVRKEARKSIAEGLLGAIHEQTPSKLPANDPTTPSLPSPSTAPGQIIQPSNTPSTQTTPAQINQPTTETVHEGPAQITQAMNQLALPGSFGREIANLTKFYTDEVKYSSEQDNFDFKFEIFQTVESRKAPASLCNHPFLKPTLDRTGGAWLLNLCSHSACNNINLKMIY